MPARTASTLQFLQKKLRSTSFLIYKEVMNELFLHHGKHGFVNTLQGYFRSGRYDLALRFADSLSEQKYSDATLHFVANQFALLIRKYPWDPKIVKTDPESKALEKFNLAERKCYLLNKKFSLYGSLRSPHEKQLEEIRNFIQYVIGSEPNLQGLTHDSAFGAGASIGVHGNATNLLSKLSKEKWSVSPGALTYSLEIIASDPHLRDLFLESRNGVSCLDLKELATRFKAKVSYVNYNKLCFVPKTASTHRAIAVEPLLNGLVQKGIDTQMRNLLKRIGIDLSDQKRNQDLAFLGSMTDSDESFVTIDLSSASDNISIGLVRNVLPPAWFDLLNHTRSHNYRFGDSEKRYFKFCSMGNGFCFPLETLIFTACCKVAGAGTPGADFSVYGDDIVVRKKHAGSVLALLKVLGFSPNIDKTFLTGSFRESCGGDFFGGVDVRPYTLDYELNSLESLFKWLNLTRRNELSTQFFSGTESVILSHIPHRFRFWRPYKGNSDSGIDVFGSEHLTSPNCFFDRRKQLWFCKELVHRPLLFLKDPKQTYRRDSVDMYALLSGVKSHKYSVGYTYRRKTRTTVTFTGYSSATAMWLP